MNLHLKDNLKQQQKKWNDNSMNERIGMFYKRLVVSLPPVDLLLILRLFISLEWNERVIFGQWSDEREHREELLEATFRKSGYVHKGKKGLLVS